MIVYFALKFFSLIRYATLLYCCEIMNIDVNKIVIKKKTLLHYNGGKTHGIIIINKLDAKLVFYEFFKLNSESVFCFRSYIPKNCSTLRNNVTIFQQIIKFQISYFKNLSPFQNRIRTHHRKYDRIISSIQTILSITACNTSFYLSCYSVSAAVVPIVETF